MRVAAVQSSAEEPCWHSLRLDKEWDRTFLMSQKRKLQLSRYSQCQSHFKMSWRQLNTDVVFLRVKRFVFHGLLITQCRRRAPERSGRLRLFHCPLQTAGQVCVFASAAGVVPIP